MIEGEDAQIVDRIREKCRRNEIDPELMNLVRTIKSRGVSVAMCNIDGSFPYTGLNGIGFKFGSLSERKRAPFDV